MPRKFLRDLRVSFHIWENKGFNEAEVLFKRHYSLKRNVNENDVPSMVNVLWGKVQYLKMVRGENDPIVMKYLELFGELTRKGGTNLSMIVDFLNNWENSGFDSAYNNFKDDKRAN